MHLIILVENVYKKVINRKHHFMYDSKLPRSPIFRVTFQITGKIFFLKNQQDALIIHIYSVIKLYMSRASSLPIIRSFLLYIRHW